jgi:hypothetical protein
MGPALLQLALDFHRAPIRFRHLTDPRAPLPEAFGDWLVQSSAALAPSRISDTAASLGTQPEALREAFLFLLRQVLLPPRADHYRVLGLSRRCTTEAIKQHHGLLVRMFHPDRLPEGDERGVVLASRINAAYRVLRDTEARARYDRSLPAPRRGGPYQGDAQGFFRAREPAEPLVWRPDPQPPVRGRPWRRPRLRWLLAGVPIAALVLFLLEEPGSPMLRVDPERADRASPGPAYLSGPEGGGPTDAPATGPAAGSASGSIPGVGTGARPPVEAATGAGPGRVQSTSPPGASVTVGPGGLQEGRVGPETQSPADDSEDSRTNPMPDETPTIDNPPNRGPAPTGQMPPRDASLTHHLPRT